MTTSPSAAVGANVRAEMARRGVTQAAIAEVIGVTQPGVSKRLRGETPFDVNEIAAIADFLGVSASSLMPAGAVTAA